MAVWEVRVTDLVLEFAGALRTLVPQLDAARIAWRVPERYDDFDRVAEALYASFVLSPVVHDQRFSGLGLDDVRPFGFRGGDWAVDVEASLPDGPGMLPLVDLDSVVEPFDTAVLGHDERIAVPLLATGFHVTRGDGDHVATLKVS